MQISFGNKIPISKAQIYDKNAQGFKKAMLYELDGKDASDMDEVTKDPGAWEYKYCMTAGLADKIDKLDLRRGGG